MRFYDEEDVPQGKRFCTTCDKFFDTDNFVFVSEHRGVTFYLDSATGAAHTLLGEKISAARKRKLYPTKNGDPLDTPHTGEGAALTSVFKLPRLPTPLHQVN